MSSKLCEDRFVIDAVEIKKKLLVPPRMQFVVVNSTQSDGEVIPVLHRSGAGVADYPEMMGIRHGVSTDSAAHLFRGAEPVLTPKAVALTRQ